MCEKTGETGRIGRSTVFLDRDGTINEEVNYLHRPEDLRILPGAAEGIRLWNEHGFRVVVVTNQAGVARGYYSEQDVEALHRYMNEVLAEKGAHIDGFYYCPHHPEHGIGPYKTVCRCRKPGTGMLEAADRDCPVDREHSYMIGDKWLDTQAGDRFGLHTVLVGTGYGEELYRALAEENNGDSSRREENRYEHPMDFYGKDLLEAARWILEREGISCGEDGGKRGKHEFNGTSGASA